MRFTTLVLLSVLAGFSNLTFGLAEGGLDPSKPKLTITYLNCGQGDAAVVETPQGKIFLIDAGPNEQMTGGQFDAGESVVVPFLNKIRVKMIDGIVLSHPHLDHYGGVFSVLKRFKVRQFIDSGAPSGSPHYLRLLEGLDRNNILYKVVMGNERLNWDPEIKAEVLGPPDKSHTIDSGLESINNRSIVLKLTYGKISFLFAGDIESTAEEYLVETFSGRLKCDVLKVAHHGSKTSSTQKFLEMAEPKIAVISCGRKNDYGHPHRAVLKRLNKIKAKIYRTDRKGSIQIITDGSHVQVRTLKRS